MSAWQNPFPQLPNSQSYLPRYEPQQSQQFQSQFTPQYFSSLPQIDEENQSTNWPKIICWFFIICLLITFIVLFAVYLDKYLKAKKTNDSQIDSSNKSLIPSQNTPNTSQTSLITEAGGLCLSLNSKNVDDYVVLKPKNASDPLQQWTQITTSNIGIIQIVNPSTNFALTVNGGNGSIVASINTNSPNQLWKFQSESIIPNDSIYATPSEPTQLVLAIGQATMLSGYSQSDISAVLQGQIIPESTTEQQNALDQASGNSSVIVNGLPATLLPQSSVNAGQTWTFS